MKNPTSVRHEKTLLIRLEFLNHSGTLFGGYLMVRTMQAINRANAVRGGSQGDQGDGLPPGVDRRLRRQRRL